METSVRPEPSSLDRIRRARTLRRVGVGVLWAFLLAGLGNLLGARTASVEAASGPYQLAVEYPSITRAGLPAELRIRVMREGGFDSNVTITVSLEYLDLFHEQGLQPFPASLTADGDRLHWEFDHPPGDTLVVRYLLRTKPTAHRGRPASVTVLEGGRDAVRVDLTTRVVP